MATALLPDPSAGLFETMLVAGGRPVELDAHLARLAASLEAVFGTGLPRETPELARERADGIDLGRLRLTVTPGRAGPRVEGEAADVEPELVFPGPERPIGVRSLPIAGGLGAHKWADRRRLEAAEAEFAPEGAVPLVVDRDGAALEATRASVFALRDGALLTPPLDGRILPGVTRARVLENAPAVGAPAEERKLTVGDLIAADEVFLAGSVRGVEHVGSIDGVPLAGRGGAGARIAAELRRAWLPAPAAAR